MSMLRVSVITASFNRASTVRETLESVNEQTYPAIEHIIVDGGSTDETMSIVRRYGKRLSTAISEADSGIYDAFNKGLRLATGDVIGFLNSDDVYADPKSIASIVAPFSDESVEAAYADLVYVRHDDTSHITRYWKSHAYRPGDFERAFVPPHPTLFLRRRVYERTGGFDCAYRLAGDYEYMLRAFHSFGIKSVYIPKVLVKMRTGGATGGSLISIRQQNREILQALAQHAVPVSRAGYFARKIANRLVQRVRATLAQPSV